MDTKWYLYEVGTLKIIDEGYDYDKLLDKYDDDLHGITASPAFHCINGLHY